MQDEHQDSEKMMVIEQFKSMPFGLVWDEYCRRQGVPVDGQVWAPVAAYEKDVLAKRN